RMKLLLAAALFVLYTFDSADSSAYDKILTHSRIRARKEGPNVCALQQVVGTKKKYFSTCRNWYHGAICGKKATVLYECCPGYIKLDGMRGCPAVAPIDHVYGSLGIVKASSTQKYADISKVRPEIEGSGSFTFFAPSNEAWELLDEDVRNALVSNVNIELYNALHYHMANKRLLTKDLKNGMTITSMYNDLDLHINHYSNGVVTVNCARIISGNQIATNGVVHVIDRVISAIGNSMQDVIEVEDDLTTLSDLAQTSGLLEKLGQPGHYTLFAPTNDAFDKLGSDVLERLQSDKEVLKGEINFQCSEAIMVGSSYETLEGNNIEIGCDGDSLTVNGVKMVLKKDIVTKNGVIHLIDQVLLPDSAKQVMELLGSSQSTFGDMISELGISTSMASDAEYTFLAPLNDVFTDEVMSIDQDDLRVILENHVLKNKIMLGQLYNGQLLETIAGKTLRVFIYRTAVCIENSCLIRGTKEGANGALHLMKTLLKPAAKTMFEILKQNGNFKIFLSLMEAAGLTDVLRQEGSFTLFAPSDKAFASLATRDLELVLCSNKNALKTILLYHLTNAVFVSGGLEVGVTNLLKSLQGSSLKLIFANSTTQVNSVKVPEADIMATNGVVHFVNQVLYPGDMPVGSQDLLMVLRKLVTYIQVKVSSCFKHISGYTSIRTVKRLTDCYSRVTMNFYCSATVPGVTRTRFVERQPNFQKITIEGEPSTIMTTRVVKSGSKPRLFKEEAFSTGRVTGKQVLYFKSLSLVRFGLYECLALLSPVGHRHTGGVPQPTSLKNM
uniref:Periostin n=1 Tax=Oryzias sinensis TaxID=183150 RepID=A0A8C8A0R5_9TELE